MVIYLVPEGDMEKAVAAKLLPFYGHVLGTIYDQGNGCDYIREDAVKFRHLATESTGVLVLTDFRDAKVTCVADALQKYILDKVPNPPRTFLCRFAVNEIESWLLADRKGLAEFMNVAVSKIPAQPESEEFPKRTLVNLARASRKRKIREGIAPPPGHYAAVGPDYMCLMREFITDFWNIEIAMRCAPSLERCVRRLRELSIAKE